MLSTFNRNKSKLIIASLAAGFGVHLHTLAQAANDSGKPASTAGAMAWCLTSRLIS